MPDRKQMFGKSSGDTPDFFNCCTGRVGSNFEKRTHAKGQTHTQEKKNCLYNVQQA